MKSRKSIRKLRGGPSKNIFLEGSPPRKIFRGGRNDLSYVNPSYSIPSTSSGNNILVPTGNIVRPSIPIVGGARSKTKRRQRGAGLPFPIASRNLSRHEPLYPAIHARLIGGANRTHRKHKSYKGGFSPAIMGPLIDNFHYIAPAVGLVAYRYYDQIKNRSRKHRRTHRK